MFKTMEALQDTVETLQKEVNHYKDRTNELEVQIQQIRNEHQHCRQNPQQNSENVVDVVEPFPTELISSLLEGLQDTSFMGQFTMVTEEGQEERNITLLPEQTAFLAAASSPSSVAIPHANDNVPSPMSMDSIFFDPQFSI
jgi:cell division septum initiation protein DivIVA